MTPHDNEHANGETRPSLDRPRQSHRPALQSRSARQSREEHPSRPAFQSREDHPPGREGRARSEHASRSSPTTARSEGPSCPISRQDADFESEGTRCAAWLYRPATDADPPIVVMAHGFGGERGWGLPAFAERFAARGMAVLLFDYRRFGDSDGSPRNLITPSGHVSDWLAAIEHARDIDGIDGERLALWGTSFSGGHVLTAAARDGGIDALVAQAPFTDGLATVRNQGGGLGDLARAVVAGLRDVSRSVTRRRPYYVPIAGSPDEFAVLTAPGTREAFDALAGGDWKNRCPARILLTVPRYRPLDLAPEVSCPALVMKAEGDSIIPGTAVDRVVEDLADVDLEVFPGEHFDFFRGETFEAAVTRQARFLEHHLQV